MNESDADYQVIISREAARMLASHASFLANVSPDAAECLISSFERAANSLQILPHRCPWLSARYIPENKYRYLIFEKRYMLLFQIMDDKVYADYVLDCRQDYDWLLR